MYLFNSLVFNINAQHIIGGVTYPAGHFLDPAARDAIGVIEVIEPVPPETRYFRMITNPDGSTSTVPVEPEVTVDRVARDEVLRVQRLWQSAHDYEFAQITGSAIGLLTIGVIQGLPKSLAMQAWIKSIWTAYYTAKETGAYAIDFAAIGDCPHTIPELMVEVGV